MPTARFFFDAGSGTLLWRTDRAAGESFVELDELPISDSLREELLRLVDEYDTSMNSSYPPDPGPWRESQCRRFNAAARQALQDLREELGSEWEIRDEFDELHEDPDLDRYLADPAGFRRETPRRERLLRRWFGRS